MKSVTRSCRIHVRPLLARLIDFNAIPTTCNSCAIQPVSRLASSMSTRSENAHDQHLVSLCVLVEFILGTELSTVEAHSTPEHRRQAGRPWMRPGRTLRAAGAVRIPIINTQRGSDTAGTSLGQVANGRNLVSCGERFPELSLTHG